MNNQTLIDAAKAFIEISDYRFDFTVGKGKKILKFSVSVSIGEATHICGLDHIPYINALCGNKTTSKTSVLKKIANGNLRYSSFPSSDKSIITDEIPKTFNPISQKPYTLEDRIKILNDL